MITVNKGKVMINIRILNYKITGVQRYTLELLNRFAGRVNQITTSKPLNGIRGHMWEQLVLPGLVGSNLLWSPSNTGPLAVKQQVVTIHDVVALDHPEWLDYKFAAWYRFLTPRLIRRVKKIITISEFTKQRILEHVKVPEEKIAVVYNGVDKRFFPVEDENIREVVGQLQVPSRHYILIVGSIEPRKNLKRLLEAWELVQNRLPDEVWLVIAGAKGKKQVFGDFSLDRLPQRTYLTGHVPDDFLPALYSGAIAFAYVSLYEGFGLPPLEAMACGTPVLTSNVTSLPEVVGDAAIMVDPYDVEAIAYGLERLVEDSSLRENLRQKGLERAKLFSWDKAAAETWQVLDDAAKMR